MNTNYLTDMRKLFFVAFIASLLLNSCQKAPELTITSPTSIELSSDGSNGSITFTANRDWSVSCSENWIHVNPSNGTAADAPVTVSIRCDANTTYDDRSAVVTIRMEELSQSVTIKQPANLGIILPRQVFELLSDEKTIEVEVQANVQYQVESSVDWIKLTGTKALSTKTLVFKIQENTTYDAREGRITIKPENGRVQEQVISVKQAQKDAMIVGKTTYDIPYGGGEIDIKVESNVTFDVHPSVEWIHYIQTKALSSSNVVLTIDENQTYATREGSIEIIQQNGSLKHIIKVKQDGRIAVTSIGLNLSETRLKEGETQIITAIVKPDNATDKTVTWSSDNTDIASVNSEGKITAIKEGETIITASAGQQNAKCKVVVYKDVPVKKITLDRTSLILYIGSSDILTATIEPENAANKTVTWSSSDPNIASVSESGEVTAIAKGGCIITATVENRSASCSIGVYELPTTLSIVSSAFKDGPETNYRFFLNNVDNSVSIAVDPYPPLVKWSSSDDSIASIKQDDCYQWSATIKAVNEGIATITAKAGEFEASCTVKVKWIPEGAVDLGIIMTNDTGSKYRLYWAPFNIGASAEDDPIGHGLYSWGEHYAWGEIEPGGHSSVSSYKWWDGTQYTKYGSDGKNRLDLEDDVAHVTLGGNWRIPTRKEWQKLLSHCYWKVYEIKKDVGAGQFHWWSGYQVSSGKAGIALPCAGWTGQAPDGIGLYWCSDLNNKQKAYEVVITPYVGETAPNVEIQSWDRYLGMSIRPVWEEPFID